MKVLVTGGSGFVGSILCPMLAEAGHEVTILDRMWFGAHTEGARHICYGDIRNPEHLRKHMQGRDAVIHLACLSNDESCDADRQVSEEINFTSFPPMVKLAKELGVQRFIYASTSAVYGPSPTPRKETDPLNPMFSYAKWKAACEPILLEQASNDFICTVLRPAALMGYAPRMRLDLAVNILTNWAVNKGRIEVWGGEQMRSTLHVWDMARAYLQLLDAPAEQINGEVFNVGGYNYSLSELGRIIASEFEADLEYKAARDDRSYQLDSSKWSSTFEWYPRSFVEFAALEMADAHRQGRIPEPFDNSIYYNAKHLASLDLSYTPPKAGEADLLALTTHPIASRIPGGSAPPPSDPVEREKWYDRWRQVGGLPR
ncbi:MAG: NAD-dependent epimerase/dehydratase family protein [Methylocystis sp.]|uniref:NAD-dependent epimerase/dehydratase family protein n=1 Tax=Methylocystis sp. TaxID=1911079 RepID=UPI003DA631E7